MGQLFIDEVRAIVLKNISNEKFGVGDLSSQLGLSSSQTLRKVKAASGKSVNQYIRELRLEKAAKLIKKTDDSMAEISYQVGFSSPSYFNKAFAKYYGIAPGEYKTKSISLSEMADQKPEPQPVMDTKKIGYVLAIVLVGVLGYFLLQGTVLNKKPEQKSIAVLPFKDFSPEDSQWFSDGVSDNILHSLAQMQDLSVTSFTSSSTYRNTDKQIPQIAKELDVAYVLEGSVTLYENDIKIIVQLIDEEDNHVWSKEYNEQFDDIITIQNNVSQEVLKQLELTLSPEEQNIVEKYPTDNMEAYNLHLEGRRINQSMKYVDLMKNMRNNEKAIALDSNFVEAYVDLAATKLVVAIEGDTYAYFANDYSAKEAMAYIDKALTIDPNSAKGNAVKARLLLANNRSNSEKYFKKALALNPSDAETRHWYAKYFLTAEKPDLKKALQQATMAKNLSPFSSAIATRYTWILILNNEYDEALAYLDDYGFLLDKMHIHLFNIYAIAFKNKDWQPAVDWINNNLETEPENEAINYFLLALGYNQILINKAESKEFFRKAYESDSGYLYVYFRSLTKNGYFKEAEQLMQTDDFKEQHELLRLRNLWEYYYFKKDLKKAEDLINENRERGIFGFDQISKTYAQLGDRKKLDSINSLYFIQGEAKNQNQAYVYAILQERDSMYYHLNKLKYTYDYTLSYANGSPEFDPYRHEERYKNLLRELYIPTAEELDLPTTSDK